MIMPHPKNRVACIQPAAPALPLSTNTESCFVYSTELGIDDVQVLIRAGSLATKSR